MDGGGGPAAAAVEEDGVRLSSSCLLSGQRGAGWLTWCVAGLVVPGAAAHPLVLVNHVGYDVAGPKRAIVQGRKGDAVRSCEVEDDAGGARVLAAVPRPAGSVGRWRDWTYWTVDFSSWQREGEFRVTCTTGGGAVSSPPFHLEKGVLERRTLSDVLYYFKGQRASGLLDQADRALPLEGRRDRVVAAHGGWFDATGDSGKHLSPLSYSTYFNPQQIPLTAWGLLKTYDLLQRRSDPLFRQYLGRLLGEGAWGADYLVRVQAPGGSFYRSVSGPGPAKRPDDRRIARDGRGKAITSTDEAAYQSSFRAGGGVAIAALAQAALLQAPGERAADAGLPVTSLVAYLDIVDDKPRAAVLDAVRASLEWELAVTSEVANPFGYARQLVQTRAGVREARFFFPHDTETAPWWQGEDARLASLAFAAPAALPYLPDDPDFSRRL